MRLTLGIVVAGAAIAVAAGGVRPQANGLPPYIDGYARWTKINGKPIVGGSPAHRGTKNVYTSRRKQGARYPVGTIVVKTATSPGKRWLSLVATMRRTASAANGGWRWEEFTRSSPGRRFTKVGFPESGCAACHVQAKSNDYVFTRR